LYLKASQSCILLLNNKLIYDDRAKKQSNKLIDDDEAKKHT